MLCDTERDGHRIAFNEAFKQKGAGLGVWERFQQLADVCWRPAGAYCRGCRFSRAIHPWPAAGLPHEWSVEKYGELLSTGGGKERMTRYFKVRRGCSFARAGCARSEVGCQPALASSDTEGWHWAVTTLQ